MPLVWMLTIAIALWFGFEVGRKWQLGEAEEEREAEEAEAERAVTERRGVRLKRIAVRR